jgi:glycosyltransferase involved in cell wall biosynthesis
VTEPRVSVLLPTYQRAALLPRTLETLLRQTMASCAEVIVLDDGSTDATPEVMQRVCCRGIGYLRSEHLGLPGIVNAGLPLVTGEYVMLCNDHDLYAPELLEALSSALDANPSASLAVCDVVLVDASVQREIDTVRLPYNGLVSGERFLREQLLPGLGSIASCNMWRASALEGEMLDDAYGASSDLELWLRLCSRGDVVHVARPLARVRQRDATSEFYYRNHELVADALRAKRAYLHHAPRPASRRAIEASWRAQAGGSAANALLLAIEGHRLEERPAIAAFARSKASRPAALAIEALCRLPAPLSLGMLRAARALARITRRQSWR